MRQIQKWMQKHKFSDARTNDNINNLLFAKDFFSMMDVDMNQEQIY